MEVLDTLLHHKSAPSLGCPTAPPASVLRNDRWFQRKPAWGFLMCWLLCLLSTGCLFDRQLVPLQTFWAVFDASIKPRLCSPPRSLRSQVFMSPESSLRSPGRSALPFLQAALRPITLLPFLSSVTPAVGVPLLLAPPPVLEPAV